MLLKNITFERFHEREAECLILNVFYSLCFSSQNPVEQPHMIRYPKR